MKLTWMFLIMIGAIYSSSAQNYSLIWEDQFDGNQLDERKWNNEQNEGVWNTGGNKEFQHYKKENVTVGTDGNGNNCLIITAKVEDYNGYHYTSGRVNTKGKFAFRRGKMEASIRIPDLANGLWPAFWTLGYTPTGWPDCGEIDIMEMGHAAGISQNKQNSYMGAHLFWGPHPSDWGTTFVASEDLSTGYFKQTAVWTENKISVFFNNSPTPYFTMGIDGGNTEEFRNFQHYVLFNMAVGGSLPGILNRNGITANLPANMYVDWVKVYQETEDFGTDNLPLYGQFGIFEEKNNTDMRMDLGYDLNSIFSGLTPNPAETPYSGNEVISYLTGAEENFEIKLTAQLNRNMVNYSNGSMQFYMKTTVNGPIQLGISDQKGYEPFITLADNEQQNINRDGEWHLVYLPLSELTNRVDLTKLNDLFILKGYSQTESILSIDEIFYSESVPTQGYFGIFTNNPNITDRFTLDNVNGHLYNWSNTVTFNSNLSAYDGEDVLSFRSSGATGWWGFGFFSTQPLNFEKYAEGSLNLALRTTSTENFAIAIQGANETKGEIIFRANNDPYGFQRDGKWHRVSIPMSTLVAQGLNLSACGNIFTMSGGKTGDIGIDDIYLSDQESNIVNPNICYPALLELLPKNSSTKTGYRKQFRVNVDDQFGNDTDVEGTYSSNGGTISAEGIFKSDEAGTFTVWASASNLIDSTTIRVDQTTSSKITSDPELNIVYFTESKQLKIEHPEFIKKVVIYNLSGLKMVEQQFNKNQVIMDLSHLAPSVYIVQISTNTTTHIEKISNH